MHPCSGPDLAALLGFPEGVRQAGNRTGRWCFCDSYLVFSPKETRQRYYSLNGLAS